MTEQKEKVPIDDDLKYLKVTIGECLSNEANKSARIVAQDIWADANASPWKIVHETTLEELFKHPKNVIKIQAESLLHMLRRWDRSKQSTQEHGYRS